LKKLSLILLLVVLLPALFYSGYELSSISTTEELNAAIYRQQLEAILFSVNQYAWDVASNWASNLSILLNENRETKPEIFAAALKKFLDRNPSIQTVLLCDTSIGGIRLYVNASSPATTQSWESILKEGLNKNREKIERLLRFQRAEYRKIEPIQIQGETAGSKVALVFATSDNEGNQAVAAILLDEQSFVREILSTKLREAAGEQFLLAVFRSDIERPLFATSPVQVGELKQKKELWLFPNYYLGIRLKGTTIDELAQSRFYRNLVLIILLDVVLIIGAWFVYRNMRREMDLVRIRSDFVSNVSHELRTPLSLIRMFAETLEMGRIQSEEKRHEYYSTILQESERLTRLVNNILNFSRMEAGKKQYQFQDVDLNEIASGVLDTYRFDLQSKGFDPIVELDARLPNIYADREALSEAVINVLDNAIKYSDKDRYLRVQSGTLEKAIFLEIEDHGIGIAPEHHAKIYDTFYRVTGGLVHNVKGSGLGLALVKRIMDAHSGKVVLASTQGKGSTFRLQFPAKGAS